LVAIIQGTIMGITYALAGAPNALLLGVLSVILCIIPLLGAPVLYIPSGLIMLANGNTAGAFAVLGVGFLVVSQIDNLLKPFFIGGRANLHPMATFFSILGGVLLFGAVGVMAGPMLLTILIALQHIVRERVRLESGEPATLS
jgi:predicted PurR-regulated permease PerM